MSATSRAVGQVLSTVAVLVCMQVATGLVAISLLDRMSPAVGKVLVENVRSAHAVEDMFHALAESPAAPDSARQGFRDGLARARANVTEAKEGPLLDTIERLGDAALAGDATALGETNRALRELGAVNRSAIERTDDEIQRLSTAGAWAVVLLGVFGVLVGILLWRRLWWRLLLPLDHLLRAVRARRAGDRYRRWSPPNVGSEINELGAMLNELLDGGADGATPARASTSEAALQTAVIHLLDARPDPVALIDARGEILAANERAMARLASAGGEQVRAHLRSVPDSSVQPQGIGPREPIAPGGPWLCVLADEPA